MRLSFSISNKFPINVIIKDGEPWFIASEVCAALEIRNHSQAIARLDADEKGIIKTDTLGGTQNTSIISEPGLYRLISRSNKPSAKAFNRWACHEVFPAIRKTGGYNSATTQERWLACQEMASAIATAAQKAIFEQLLASNEDLTNRFLVSLDYKANPRVTRIEHDENIASLARLAKMIVEPNGLMPSSADLAALGKACMERLSQRIAYQNQKQGTSIETVGQKS